MILGSLGYSQNRFVRACAAEAVGCMARRAAVICSSSPQSSNVLPYAQLASIVIPGLSLGGEEPGVEGGAGDAARHFSNPAIEYKFSTRNMVRENASVSALSLCANAAELGDVVPEKDWLMLVKTLHGLTSARVRTSMQGDSVQIYILASLYTILLTAPVFLVAPL